jgi:alpha(1,3/1,4) fucosyltransferase
MSDSPDHVSAPGLKLSVIPPAVGMNQNALFEGVRHDQQATPMSANTHWLDCFIAVGARAKQLGVQLGTWDVLPPKDADAVIGMTLPTSKDNALDQKRKWPHLKALLITWETSLGSQYLFSPRNTTEYAAVFTYNQHLVDYRHYFPFPPRAFYPHRVRAGPPFTQRKIGILVGTMWPLKYNRTGLMALRHGWKFSFKDWLDYVFCPGELVSYRAQVGKACAVHSSGGFDLFGRGWERFPETATKSLGIPTGSTLDYLGHYRFDLAFENQSSDCSLISERIWDALWADTVPVYRGHKFIDRVIPRECYVDAAQFRSPQEMLDWLADCPEEVWSQYRQAGRAFITGAGVQPYLPEPFATRFLDTVMRVMQAPVFTPASVLVS